MSAVTRHPADDMRRDENGTPFGRESLGGLRPEYRAAPHASWRFQDQFGLWVDWMQRDSSGHWFPYDSVLQRHFRTREETLLYAERLIQRGEFPLKSGRAAPVTLVRHRRDALLQTFREAEGDGVTLIREALFPIGEYGLSLKVTCERVADEVKTTFGHGGNPVRSLQGQPVKLTVLIEHPYDVLARGQGTLEVTDSGVRLGTETYPFHSSASVVGVPYRSATVAVSRGFMKRPQLYRFELDAPNAE